MTMHTFILNVGPQVPNSSTQDHTEIEFLLTNGSDVRTLLKTCWDVSEFRDWISENLDKILTDPFPSLFGKDRSIAKCIASFYDSVNPEDDDLIDRAFEYRRVHGIRFGLRGARIPDIYVGQRCGSLEISCYSEQDDWSYSIYADSFGNEMRRLLGGHPASD